MSDPFIAEIKIVSFNYPPKGWALCNGQLLPINQNQALFSLLGVNYGGNGQTTFALPNLQGRTPIHTGNGHTLGQNGGTTAHTLAASELPSHTHLLPTAATTADADLLTPAGARAAVAPNEIYSREGAPSPMHAQAVTSAVGGSQAHPNEQPYLVLNFVIALVGIFPPRT